MPRHFGVHGCKRLAMGLSKFNMYKDPGEPAKLTMVIPEDRIPQFEEDPFNLSEEIHNGELEFLDKGMVKITLEIFDELKFEVMKLFMDQAFEKNVRETGIDAASNN